MAHYKRGKCRRNCPCAIRGSQTSWRAKHGFKPIRIPDNAFTILDSSPWGSRHRSAEWQAMWNVRGPAGNRGKKIGGNFSMMNSYPAWWDRLFHTRPQRAKARVVTRRVLTGTVDADEAIWPLAKKPHIYYW